jgi:hypothetical protein
VLARARVGAREEDRPARVLRVARPDLLAAHDVVVALEVGAGPERGESEPAPGSE